MESNTESQGATIYLKNEKDFIDGEGRKWRCAAGEMKIKQETLGPTGTNGWKLFHKYTDIVVMARDWAKLKQGDPESTADDAPEESVQEISERMSRQGAFMVEVLPPEKSLPEVQVDHSPESVISQWRRANAGLLEIVRFGAMLVEIDTCLKRQTTSKSKHDPSGEGPSIKKWLEIHCPDINYHTAIGYKLVAEQMRDKYKIPAKLPLTLALPKPDGTIEAYVPDTINIEKSKVEKYQREFYGMCEGKSMYQLTLDLGIREPKPRGGDRKSGKDKTKLTKEQQLELQIKAAGEYWNNTLNDMCFHVNKTKSHKLLNEAELTQALTRLRVVADALKDALKKDTE